MPTSRTISRWVKWLAVMGAVVISVGIAGTVIRVPYGTLSPGGALSLEPRVSVPGAKTYPDHGDVMLLFVRERSHVNLWSWLQAKLDPNIDLVKQQDLNRGNTQQGADRQAVCDMLQSQVSAKVAALTSLGYRVPVLHGLEIIDLPSEFVTRGPDGKDVHHPLFAIKVLQPCDAIVSADGHVLKKTDDLSKIVRVHRPGTEVTLGIIRGDKTLTVQVPVVSDSGRSIIGVSLALRYKIPLRIVVDTSNISGPSAGLAIALAIIDDLTPGDLTGGKHVAVTGTIDPEGRVGEIGALSQKAVAARAAHAQIFIVPACADASSKSSCSQDLEIAKKRVGRDVQLSPVSTLAQALKVLRDAGGAPVHAFPTA